MLTCSFSNCIGQFLLMMAEKNLAEGCLKLWEGFVFSDPKKVGSLNHGSYSNGESGPLRLILDLFLNYICSNSPILNGRLPY